MEVVMAVKVFIPTPLRNDFGGKAELSLEAKSIKELIVVMDAAHPASNWHARIYASGKFGRFVQFFVGQEDIRSLQGEDTLLKDGDEVSVVPPVAGG